MSNEFLPENYKVPTTSNYMKLQKGANRFRILSSAITGWEIWVTEIKEGKEVPQPLRQREPFEILPDNVRLNEHGQPDKQKHFWAFVVFNYQEERVQILELTQTGVQKAIKAIVQDEDWGDPKGYDLVVTGEKDGLERRYQTNPKPHKPIDLTDAQATVAASINLEALYESKDPFEGINTVTDEPGDDEPQEEINLKDINL